MCSICGGTQWDKIGHHIFNASKDRGRDAHGIKILDSGKWIANHRATPTTEVEFPIENQPVGNDPYFVFNGIISNDSKLGIKKGEADTSVLPRIIRSDNLENFHSDICKKIVGSYAIACMQSDKNIFLSCNYKPIWVLKYMGHLYFSSLKSHFPFIPNIRPWKMEPYSSMLLQISSEHIIQAKRSQSKRALVICSSGLDSTAVAAYAKNNHKDVTLIHFDYNCLAGKREKEQIVKIAKRIEAQYIILDIPKLIFGDSSPLLSDKKLAVGKVGAEYAHEWVPARNLVMLSLTVAYAEANNYGHIYLGTNLEEAGAYPDNEEQFILDFKNLLYGAVQNGIKIDVHTPLGGLMKHEVVPFGIDNGAPFDLTWSCYKGGEKHCGKCGPDFMRKEAFRRNGIKDPVFKHDWNNSFWGGCKNYGI